MDSTYSRRARAGRQVLGSRDVSSGQRGSRGPVGGNDDDDVDFETTGSVSTVASTAVPAEEATNELLAVLDSYAFSEPLRFQFRRDWSALVQKGFEPLERALVERVMAALTTPPASRHAVSTAPFHETREAELVGEESAPPGSPVSSGGGDLADDFEPSRSLAETRQSALTRPTIHTVHVPAPRGILSASVWMELYRTVLLLCTKPGPCAVKRALYEQVEREMGAFCTSKILPDMERRIPTREGANRAMSAMLSYAPSGCSPMRELEEARSGRSALRAGRARTSMDTQSSHFSHSKSTVGDSDRDQFPVSHQSMEEGSLQGIELMDMASDDVSDTSEENNGAGASITSIEELLHAFCAWWMAYQHLVQFVCKIFSYLDRCYTDKENGPPPLEHLGRILFRTKVLDKMRDVLRTAILTLIARDRSGEVVDRALIHSAVVVFTATDWVSYYTDEIETPYLAAFQTHYAEASERWLRDCSFPEYMREAEAALRQEIAIAQAVLHPSSMDRVKDAIENVILLAHEEKLLAAETSGFVTLLSQRQFDDLKRVYWLYSGKWIHELCGQPMDGNGGLARSNASGRLVPESQAHQERALRPIAQQFARCAEAEGAGLFAHYDAITTEMNPSGDSVGYEDSDRSVARKRHADGSEKQETGPMSSALSCVLSPKFDAPYASCGPEAEISPTEQAGMWLVRELVNLHETYQLVLRTCFENHEVFSQHFRMAFESILNNPRDMSMIPKLLASYVDRVLQRIYMIEPPGADLSGHLRVIVQLLEYVYDKDVFADLYQFLLCRRLIFDLSIARDLEITFVEELKAVIGPLFTARVEGMLRDMRTSLRFQERFNQWNAILDNRERQRSTGAVTLEHATPSHTPVFQAILTTTSIWPSFPSDDDLRLPPALASCLTEYECFYAHQTQYRQLRWIHVLSKGLVECTRAAFPYMTRYDQVELELNTYQLCMLLLFEDRNEMTFEQICDALNIQAPEILDLFTRCVLSLCNKKHCLFIKSPAGAELRPTDTLQLNRYFDPQQRRLSFAYLADGFKREECQATRQNGHDDQVPLLEATIVRIMKMHRQFAHQKLVAGVQNALSTRFTPDVHSIKERIESLIAREYLERDPQDPSLYHYLA